MWKITLVFMGALLFGQNNQIKFEANAPSGVEVFSASGFKAGNAKYCYWIVTTFPIGNVISKPTCYNNVSIPSVASPITITWQGVSDAISYTVLRTDTEWLPQGNNNIAVGTGALVWQTDVNVLSVYALNNVVGRVEANIQLDNKRANIPKVHISRPISTPGYDVSGVPLASNHLSDGANLEKISNKDQLGGYVGLDANGNVAIGTTVPTGGAGVLTVGGGTTGGTGVINASFINPADSDMWIKIRSGATASQRAYLAWFDQTETMHKWLTGRNADNAFVLFDAASAAHRMRFVSGGTTNIDSVGTAAVRINQYDSASGTGGLEVWSGGDPRTLWTRVNANGIEVRKGILHVNPSAEAGANIVLQPTAGRDAYVTLRDGTTNKWFWGKHGATGNARLYNYTTATDAWVVSADTNAMTFGGTVAASGGSANKVVCWKADGKTLGYCSDAPEADGSCTCN